MHTQYTKKEEKTNYKHKIAAIGRLDLLIKRIKDAEIADQLLAIRREVCKIQ